MTNPATQPSNTPLYTMIATVICIVAGVALVIFGPAGSAEVTTLIGLLATTIPSIVSSLFSERASRDIRNGVLVEKVKQGAEQAIEESQVIRRDGPVVAAELAALARLLEVNTNATQTNTQQLQDSERGGEHNGG